jgi:hypothetical protein
MSNDLKKVVAQTTFTAEVNHTKQKFDFDLNKKCFVEIKPSYSDKQNHKTKGVLSNYSLKDLQERLNNFKGKVGQKKADNPAILKGMYNGGTKGEYCTETAPFVIFDIDVKNNDVKRENVALFDEVVNNKVFAELQKIALLVWRSNSGRGIAGVLYVPQIAEFNNETRNKHKKTSEAIYLYLSNYIKNKIGLVVEFDKAQGTFRQIRYLADQKGEIRNLNLNPFVFRYKTKEVRLKTFKGVQKYYLKNQPHPCGTIPSQFNRDSNIKGVLTGLGFEFISSTRVKNSSLSQSSTTGFIDELKNIYINFSEGVQSSLNSNKRSFTPFDLILKLQYNNDFKQFLYDLEQKGYKEIKPTITTQKTAENKLKSKLNKVKTSKEAEQIIFEQCFELRTLSAQEKISFINKVNPKPEYKKYFFEYLKVGINQKIVFDETYKIDKFVSEQFEAILNEADKSKKVIVHAETGTGKTTAIFKEFKKLRPESRCIILAPLTIIVNQLQKDHPNEAIFLTGASSHLEHLEALKSSIVVATYEQGIKHIKDNCFDYIFVDEVHQFLTANSYKNKTISEATQNLIGKKIIGLTGTPQQIFNNLGFKLISLTRSNQTKPVIKLRYWNIAPFKIIINHLRNVKGKVLFKLDEKTTIDDIKTELLATGFYSENEILVLSSTKKIKNSKDYKGLANNRSFRNDVKIVLTTSIINEGLSIEQIGFTDIVFIETSFNPRPEPIKQFFARFRNLDPNRTNYLYLKHHNETKKISLFNWKLDYKNKLDLLTQELANIDLTENLIGSYNDVINPKKFFYSTNEINPFYLAYNVTECYFKAINKPQFIEFLENNYNLKIILDKNFITETDVNTEDHKERLFKRKNSLAEITSTQFAEVLDVLSLETQNKKLKKKIHFRNLEVKTETAKIVINEIKTFEYLAIKYFELEINNIHDPKELIEDTKKGIVIKSNHELEKMLFKLNIERLLRKPKNQTDHKNRTKLITFCLEMEKKKTFTFQQIMRELKKQNVLNFNSYNKETCFFLFKSVGYVCSENKKTGLISLFAEVG